MLSDDATRSALRQRYRAWLADKVPAGWRQQCALGEEATLAVQRDWLERLRSGGWAAPHWPTEHGGMGATLAEQIVLQEENTRAGAPSLSMFGMAFVHAAATIIEFGSPDQRQRHLPRILAGEEVWCQGFSEPGAGSDLAALSTRAERVDGDRYVVNGQKVWSSGATRADRCMLLARTDPGAAKQRGISYFLLDMHTPGIEIRPIRSILGSDEFCELFLDEVEIPLGDRVGAENDGWRIAQTTLTTERGTYLLPVMNELRGEIDAMRAMVAASGDGPLGHAGQILARNYADVAILGELVDRVLLEAAFGRTGPESSILKVLYSELAQRLTADALELRGLPAQQAWDPVFEVNAESFDGNWARSHYWSWAWTIAGGTNEIQRNIIGERVLGLPREPRGRRMPDSDRAGMP